MKIEIVDVSKKYKENQALSNFSLTLKNGVYGILGENGAGKSTLLNILVGLIGCDKGSILVDGKNAKLEGVVFLSKIGYLPQYPEFYKDFTVERFLKYMCALKDIPKIQWCTRINKLLDEVNLLECKGKKIRDLSGGMKQRVGIVQAMLNDPSILILDEPTAGLDPQERIRFRNIISKFSDDRIVLLATHIVSDIEFIANRVIVMKKGQLIKNDTIENLVTSIKGKIRYVELEGNNELEKYTQYKISNIQRKNNKLAIRYIADGIVSDASINVLPNLEEVFLYYCGEI
ncbi:ATP-binding cassette domain-containing protein [Fusibacter bizertensis]